MCSRNGQSNFSSEPKVIGAINVNLMFESEPWQPITIGFILQNPSKQATASLQIVASVVHNFDVVVPQTSFSSNILGARGQVSC